MKCSWASTFFFSFPYVRSHTLRVLSSEAVYRNFPFGCKAKPLTQLSCPTKVWSSYPLWAKKSLTSLSRLEVRMKVCWYEEIPLTPYFYSCLISLILNSCVNLCLRKSALISCCPCYPSISIIFSMTFSCAKNLKIGVSLSMFHNITLWSSEQDTKVLESWDATTFLTHPSCPL